MHKSRRIAAVTGSLALAGLGVMAIAGVASANSPRVAVTVGGVERCAAMWLDASDSFSLADKSTDSRYCYVRYAFNSGADDYRINKGVDYNVPNGDNYAINPSGQSTVWWKVCRELPGAPDNCSSTRSDAT